VGPTSISEKGAETYSCFENHNFWALRGLKLLLREKMLKRVTVFKIMPSGHSVGPTSISENGAVTYNCLQNHAFWALRAPNFYFEKRC
jgi:hypothetical protein